MKRAKELHARICKCIADGDVDEVRRALAGASDTEKALLARVDAEDNALLVAAVMSGNCEMIDVLVRVGCDVNRFCGHASPLYIAAMEGKLQVVRSLVSHGAELNSHHLVTDATPLMIAIECGHNAVALELIELGANFKGDALTVDGNAAIDIAGIHDNAEMFMALAERGALEDRAFSPLLCALLQVKTPRVLEALMNHPEYRKPAYDGRLELMLDACPFKAQRERLLSLLTRNEIASAFGAQGERADVGVSSPAGKKITGLAL